MRWHLVMSGSVITSNQKSVRSILNTVTKQRLLREVLLAGIWLLEDSGSFFSLRDSGELSFFWPFPEGQLSQVT